MLKERQYKTILMLFSQKYFISIKRLLSITSRANSLGRTIVIVSTFQLPIPGAAWRRLSYFAEHLSLKGWKVYVLGAFSPTRELLRFPIKLVAVKCSGKYALLNLQLRLDLLGWPSLIMNILGSLPVLIAALVLRPDVLFVSIPLHDVLPMAYVAAKLSGSKLVIDVRDPLEYWLHLSRGLSRRFYSLLVMLDYMFMRKADLVVTVTPGLAGLLAKHGVRAHLVMNGADTRVFRPRSQHESRKLPLCENKVTLVFNGYLGNYYDAIPLLQAIARLPDELKRRVVLLLVGGFSDASYARKFVRVAKELRLSGNVKVLQPIQDTRMLAKVLSAANAGVVTLVSSELFDPAIPAKFYEYLACGLPVIALTRRGSELWRLITKWGVGFACEPHDLDCITNALEKIFDENIMESIRASVLRVRPLIDRRWAAEKLYSLLRELLEPRRDA
jgi:glycosyltransferase involved in cell wall biosynthesis